MTSAGAPGSSTAQLEPRLVAAGQEHLLAHATSLGEPARSAFLEQLSGVPWERLTLALSRPLPPIPPDLRPPEALTLRRQWNEGGVLKRLGAMGSAWLASGKVATALLAGGQGTRLGYPGPKGTYVLGPDRDRSLYAILLERIAATAKRAGRPIPLVLLVSRETEGPTREHFEANRWFGLPKDFVRFVRQAELPALDDAGKALLAAPGRLALSPDGHGGLVGAFQDAGIFDWLASLGIEALTTFQVDNPLGRPLDPVFLGWMLERHAAAVGKAVRKRDATEKVGVYARGVDGRVRIVEYSELPEGGAPDLVLGSIAIHAFSLAWIRSLVASPDFALPFHRARKRVAHLDASGKVVEPSMPNATKLEQFLFDLLPLAERVAVHEVDRAREFAPVKNATGEDSPETARKAVEAEISRWHRVAGRPVPDPVPSLRPLDVDGPEDLAPAKDATRA